MMQSVMTILSRTEVWLGMLALAAFLGLTWALRGAPLGQEVRDDDEESGAPGAGYRDRVVLAIVGGMLLVLAGAHLALTGRLAWSLPAFVLGFGIVITLIAVNRRYRHGSPSLRRTMELSNSALSAALVAGILIVLNVLAFRYGGHGLDLTREHSYSLSSLTLNQLKALKRPVTFTVFAGDSLRSRQQRDRVEQLLELYKAANPARVSIAYLNPYTEFERYDTLLKRFPDIGVTQGGGILIEYGDESTKDHVVIRNNDLFDVVRSNPFEENTARFETSFKGEDAVTTALVRLQEGKRPKIALIVGHGEPPTTQLDPLKPGLGVLKSRLGAFGYEVIEVNLVGESVPADAELMAVVGPKTALTAEEAAKLKAEFDAGKPLLAVIGGPEKPGEKSGLEEVLVSCNLAVGSSIILDPRFNVQGQIMAVYAPVVESIRHPVVDSLVNRAVLMPRSSPITILTAAAATQVGRVYNQARVPSFLLRTSEWAWGETELTGKRPQRGEKDERGPLTVGVAVSEKPNPNDAREGKPRLVLLSSRYMADNPFLAEDPTNVDLLMNAISWLRGRAESGGIAPKTYTSLRLVVDPVLRNRLILVPTVMAVLLIVSVGLTTYMARRE